MREIGRAMEEAGAAVEYLWCSGDPDSLDGVVIPELRCAVADGTPPHGSVTEGRFGIFPAPGSPGLFLFENRAQPALLYIT